jgi:TrmH family RNA methyltransferase
MFGGSTRVRPRGVCPPPIHSHQRVLAAGLCVGMMSSLDRYHVVLVEPQDSLNIGSVARAMMNLGFQHLHLVAPRNYDRTLANVTACWALPVLDALVVHETFESALAGMEEVVGLSVRKGRNPAHYVTLPEWSSQVSDRSPRQTALVFGPEDNGLRQEHLNQCRWVIRIPSTAAFPAFNLAQSVLLTIYEIAQTLAGESGAAPGVVPHTEQAAHPTWNDFRQLDRLLDAVMTGTGFLREGTPEPVPGLVKNLFRRLDLTPHEMGVLLGLFGRINTTVQRGRESNDGT